MRHRRAYGLAALAACALAAGALAQTTVAPLPDNPPVAATPLDASAMADLAKTNWGDAKAGATKAGACAACHGLDGNPGDPQYPRLAGMPERYIAQQLALFKSGERTSGMATVMMPMASPLSAQDMRDLGAYFAQQKARAGIADDTQLTSGPYAGRKYYEVGQTLFRAGDASRGIPACLGCHGPAGDGNPGPPYPHVAGQQSPYVVRRLQEYRTGTTTQRDSRSFQIMARVARSLSDDEIQSLASYLQGLHPRADEAAPGTVATQPAPAATPAQPQPAPSTPGATQS